MKKIAKIVAMAACAVCLAISFAACSSDDKSYQFYMKELADENITYIGDPQETKEKEKKVNDARQKIYQIYCQALNTSESENLILEGAKDNCDAKVKSICQRAEQKVREEVKFDEFLENNDYMNFVVTNVTKEPYSVVYTVTFQKNN